MFRRVLHAFAAAAAALAAACAPPPAEPAAAPDAPPVSERLDMTPLADGVWVHTSWKRLERWGLISANGLVIETPDSVILVDTAWTPEATERLYAWIEAEIGKPVTAVIVTHAHDDRMGGLSVAHAHGARAYANALTIEDAAAHGMGAIDEAIDFDAPPPALAAVDVFYPGAGHTRDNIVVRDRTTGVLFGGCFIRAASNADLGNVADAVVADWAASVAAVDARFSEITVVVPGHGAPGDRSLLTHTEALARAAAATDAP